MSNRNARNVNNAQKSFSKTRFNWLHRITSLILLMSLSATTLLAAPEASVTVYNTLGEINEDIHHAVASSNFGLNIFSTDTLRAWLAKLGSKQQVLNRIVIQPADENGGLTVMQGERIAFSAIGYAGDDAINGIGFAWTVQDAERTRPVRSLNAGVFQAMKSGRYVVSATADNGQQAQVTVAVNLNEGYHLQKLIEKKDAERSDRERQGIAAMVRRGSFGSREIASKNPYNADAERVLSEADRQRRAIIRAGQIEMRRRKPNPIQGSRVSEPEPNSIGRTDRKKSKGGPKADDSEISGTEYTEPNNSKTNIAKFNSPAVRTVDEDGWNSANWYTADDPGNATGNPSGSAPDAGVGNGDFQFAAPVLSLAGRGIDVNLALVYNSRLWTKAGTQMTYDSDKGFPGPGWNIGFGKMMYMGGNGGCMLVAPDGTRRSYAGTASIYSNGTYYSNYYTGHTTDGSFIDYTCSYSSSTYGTYLSGNATLPNGTTITYSSPTGVYDQIFPTQITDSQGNYISITYVGNRGPNINTITDTLGRVITFNYDGSSRLTSVTGPGYDNTTRTFVRLTYRQLTLDYAFASGYTTDTATNAPDVVKAIYYPGTDTGYWFNDSDSYSSYGMLAKVVQQRGMQYLPNPPESVNAGTITNQKVYNFTLVPDSTLTDAPTYTKLTESWASMDTAPVETNYSVNKTTTDEIISVTLPDGTVNKQTSFLSDGFYFQGEVYASITASTPLTKTKTYFGNGDYGSSRPTRIESIDELGHTTAADFLYAANSYNQLVTQREYGYGGTALYRQTNNTYENSASYTARHIFNLLKSTETVDASGTRLTRTEYQYDNNAVVNGTSSPNLTAAPGVIMHNDTSDPFTTNTHQENGSCLLWNYPQCSYEGEQFYVEPEDPYGLGYFASCGCQDYDQITVNNYNPNSIFRGNVTKTTTYSSASNLTGATSYDFTYDITGNERTATTNCCQQMSFGYTTATQYSQPESHTKGSSDTSSPLRITESATYDFNTGVIRASTDFNGRTTTNTYDAVTRPTLVTMPTGGKTTIEYDIANLTSTQTVQLYDNTIVSKSSATLNGRGQTVLSKYLAGATNWNAASTQYDVMGRTSRTSLPYDSAALPTQRTEYRYDSLSRATLVTAPDGSTSKTFYNETARPDSASALFGQTVRSQDAWGRERWARTDDFGRLTRLLSLILRGQAIRLR